MQSHRNDRIAACDQRGRLVQCHAVARSRARLPARLDSRAAISAFRGAVPSDHSEVSEKSSHRHAHSSGTVALKAAMNASSQPANERPVAQHDREHLATGQDRKARAQAFPHRHRPAIRPARIGGHRNVPLHADRADAATPIDASRTETTSALRNTSAAIRRASMLVSGPTPCASAATGTPISLARRTNCANCATLRAGKRSSEARPERARNPGTARHPRVRRAEHRSWLRRWPEGQCSPRQAPRTWPRSVPDARL